MIGIGIFVAITYTMLFCFTLMCSIMLVSWLMNKFTGKVRFVLITIIAVLCISLLIFYVISVSVLGKSVLEQTSQDYNAKCHNLNLEYLSVTKQVFGDDYIVCYNNQTKDTREIPI